ncbi:MAG: class I SAM-dependent methyltransferase [Acidobacteria bacterium]|nr:class I SAM-dependent methyltransferase [Acidobacteriota bacterium]
MEPLDPVQVEAALASYYDQEGEERLTRSVDPRRQAARDGFLASLSTGVPRAVLEIGAGPGRDTTAFLDAGHRYVAVDPSIEHARRCHRTGAPVVLASARQLPFPTASFDAVWTMSMLMHIPNSAIDLALAEVTRVLVPGGIAALGVWGGPDVENHSQDEVRNGRPPRLFSRRSNERWRSMLADVGSVEAFETWGGDVDFFYQWAVVRKRLSG